MFVRFKKMLRFLFGKEEFNLTKEEQEVLIHVRRTLSGSNKNAHLALWYAVADAPDRTVTEKELSNVMKSLSGKLLKQNDWD